MTCFFVDDISYPPTGPYFFFDDDGIRKLLPAYRASSPSSSSILKKWLYLHMELMRPIPPPLNCPRLSPTTKSEINVEAVSPSRVEPITPNWPSFLAFLNISMASQTVPTWFGFSRMAFVPLSAIPLSSRTGFVQGYDRYKRKHAVVFDGSSGKAERVKLDHDKGNFKILLPPPLGKPSNATGAAPE